MKKPLLLASIFLIIGFVMGSLYATPSLAPSNSSTTALQSATPTPNTAIQTNISSLATLHQTIQQLQQQHQQETDRRTALEQKFNTLEEKVIALEKQVQQSAHASIMPENSSSQTNETTNLNNATSRTFDTTLSDYEAKLQEFGFSSIEIDQLKTKQDQQQLEQLYLRDKATREGWIDSQRYRDERRELRSASSIRDELGDERYDVYLYATEQYNRLIVNELMSGSAAETAGIQAGDKIIRYDNERIFSWSEIRQATLAGNAGDIVAIEVERNGEHYLLNIPRGPLGVRLDMESVAP